MSDHEEDVFTFKSHFVEQSIEFTKQQFLKRITAIFDPFALKEKCKSAQSKIIRTSTID